jgi:hypothetical protein
MPLALGACKKLMTTCEPGAKPRFTVQEEKCRQCHLLQAEKLPRMQCGTLPVLPVQEAFAKCTRIWRVAQVQVQAQVQGQGGAQAQEQGGAQVQAQVQGGAQAQAQGGALLAH